MLFEFLALGTSKWILIIALFQMLVFHAVVGVISRGIVLIRPRITQGQMVDRKKKEKSQFRQQRKENRK